MHEQQDFNMSALLGGLLYLGLCCIANLLATWLPPAPALPNTGPMCQMSHWHIIVKGYETLKSM